MQWFKVVLLTALTISLVFQLFSVITVPITSNIFIAQYKGYRFGVFGWCKLKASVCSQIRMGYALQDIMLINDNEYLHLPTKAKYALSKLLLVHAISLVCVFMLWLASIVICVFWLRVSKNVLFGAVLWSMVTFMVSLLAFLIDVLMFGSYVTWASWLMLVSAFFVALSGLMICLLIRELPYKRFVKLQKEVEIDVPMRKRAGSEEAWVS